MLYIIFVCVISALALTGMFSVIWEARKILYAKIPLCVTLRSRDLKNETEYYIRSLYAYYPYIQITVLNDNSDGEASDVLGMLCERYPSLLVINI
ncbi:MAG: hypothetical protein LUD03_03740 [Firmicutes bacterium]|nr:hypothetical protein [Bacillota bacterium]